MVIGDKLTAAQCNFVDRDQIWKDYVKKEAVAARRWDGTWGFLTEGYRTLNKDLAELRQGSQRPSKLRKSSKEAPLKLPPLKPPKQDTSHPFPMVTSKEIGWRSSRPECQLEVYGRWGRPKYSIIKHLKWPNDAVP